MFEFATLWPHSYARSHFVIPDGGWNSRFFISHYSARAQISMFASTVLAQIERFKQKEENTGIFISDDCLTSFHLMRTVQTKSKTGRKEKKGVFRG